MANAKIRELTQLPIGIEDSSYPCAGGDGSTYKNNPNKVQTLDGSNSAAKSPVDPYGDYIGADVICAAYKKGFCGVGTGTSDIAINGLAKCRIYNISNAITAPRNCNGLQVLALPAWKVQVGNLDQLPETGIDPIESVNQYAFVVDAENGYPYESVLQAIQTGANGGFSIKFNDGRYAYAGVIHDTSAAITETWAHNEYREFYVNLDIIRPIEAWTSVLDTTTGSFTGTLTGVSGSVTGSINWQKTGNVVTLQIPELKGIGDTSAITITGMNSVIPSISPSASRYAPCQLNFGGSEYSGSMKIHTDGVLHLGLGYDCGSNMTYYNFTSGPGLTSGILSQCITYYK